MTVPGTGSPGQYPRGGSGVVALPGEDGQELGARE